jgi:hypothetical protein
MPKRTRRESQDINQFAASVVAQSNGSQLPVDLDDKAIVSQIMREMGRRGGKKGAAALNGSLTAKERTMSARRAALARWGKRAK